MNKYEIMFIVNPNLEEESVKSLVKDLEKNLTKNNATIESSKELGQKRLAYEINKHITGFYFLYNVVADANAIKEIENIMRLNENVIRYLIINKDKE